MHVAFDTAELTAKDLTMLKVLVGEGDWPTIPAEAPAKPVEAKVNGSPVAKPAPAKKAPAAKPEPKPEPVAEPEPEAAPEEDLLGGDTEPEPEGPTMADAVAAATKLVSSGGAPKVKEALAAVGAKRVSEIPADQITAFLDALK